jgi:pseudomonalisin
MQKKVAVLRSTFVFVVFLTCSSFSSWSQTAQNIAPVKDLLAIRPIDRVSKPIDDTERVVLTGERHPLAKSEYEIGALAPEDRMEHMVLVLRGDSEQEAALEELTRAQQDPGSAYYHRWLTPEQFARRFGASANDVRQINAWLQIHGMEIEETPSNRAIVFSGTVEQVGSTFHTTMRAYAVKGKSHFANATDPEIPAALVQVVHGVVSLHDFVSAPMHVVAPAFTSGSAHYLMPQDWATIYDVTPLYNQGITGTGQSIAVLGRADIHMSDVQSFRSNAELPVNDPLFVVNGTDPGFADSGDQVESSLDVEWAGAIAKNATVKFITSSSGSSDGIALSAQYAVAHNIAPIVTLSYGTCEAAEGTAGNAFWNNLWQQAAAQGMSVFVSSGDSGAAGCDSSGSTTASYGKGVNGLCSSPYSTCVGGTEFKEGSNPSQYWSSTNGSGLSSALSYISESVWNESGSGGGLWSSGGGVSIVYSKPSWQTTPGVPADGKRDVPDIAMTAAIHDSYIVAIDGSLMSVGGTSASAPSLASAMALVVQNAGAAQGSPNPNLYSLATQQLAGSGAAVFHDITSGNNSVPGVTGFSAGTGYDAATGLGSIDADLLVGHWAAGSANYALTPSSSSVTLGTGKSATFTVTLTASDGFNSGVKLAATGTASGVSVKFSSATLTSAAPVTVTISAATSAAAGNSTLTINASGGGLNRTVQIAVGVVTPTFTLTASNTSVTLTAGTAATLTLTTAVANMFQSAVVLSVTGLPKGVTASFSPATISTPGNGSSALTLTAASGAASGSFNLKVTATGGGITKTLPLSLSVPVPSFNLAFGATAATVAIRSATQLRVSDSALNGFSSAVALSVTGLPKGVTATFSPASIVSGNSSGSTLTLAAASNAIAATSNLTVKAVGGGATKTQVISLTVTH